MLTQKPSAWSALVALALSGCLFVFDFPESVEQGTGASGAGAGGTGGSAPSSSTGTTSSGGGGGGGGAGGGPPVCMLDPTQHALAFDWARSLSLPDVNHMQRVHLAHDDFGNWWVAGHSDGGVIEIDGTPVPTTGDQSEDMFLLQTDATGLPVGGYMFGPGRVFVHDLVFHADIQRLIVVGWFEGQLDFGTRTITSTAPADANDYSALDGFIAVIDPGTGTADHARALGDGYYQEATAVAVAPSGNIYVALSGLGSVNWGQGNRMIVDGFSVARLGSDLVPVWSREVQTEGAGALALVALDDDSVVVGGSTEANDVFGQNQPEEPSYEGYDAFVARYSWEGEWLWHRIFGSDYSQDTRTLAVGPSGDIYFTATYQYAIAQHGEAPLYEGAGTTYEAFDVLLGRLSHSDGSTVWTKSISGPSKQQVYSMAVDCAERVTIAGSAWNDWDGVTPGPVDFGDGIPVEAPDPSDLDDDLITATYDGDGVLVAKHRLGDAQREAAYDLALEPDGGLVMAGVFFDTFVISPRVGGTLIDTDEPQYFITRFDVAP